MIHRKVEIDLDRQSTGRSGPWRRFSSVLLVSLVLSICCGQCARRRENTGQEGSGHGVRASVLIGDAKAVAAQLLAARAPREREGYIRELRAYGSEGARALIEMVPSSSPRFVGCLGIVATFQEQAVEPLLGLLAVETETGARCKVVEFIGKLGSDGIAAVPSLGSIVQDTTEAYDVRLAAARALCQLSGPGLDALVAAFGRGLGVEELAGLSVASGVSAPADVAVRAVRLLAQSTEEEQRRLAAELSVASRVCGEVTDVLWRMTEDECGTVRRSALRALGSAQGTAPRLEGLLLRWIEQRASEDRRRAVEVAAQLPTLGADLTRVLAGLVCSGDEEMALLSLRALEVNHPASEAVVETVMKAFADTRESVRVAAVRAIMKCWHEYPKTGDVVASAVTDPSEVVRANCVEAMAESDIPASISLPHLVRALLDAGAGAAFRRKVIETLGEYGSEAAAAVDNIWDVARGDYDVLAAACLAVWRIRGDPALPAEILGDLLSDRSASRASRLDAALALRDMGKDARAALADLVDALESGPTYVRCACLDSIGAIGTQDPKVVAAVERLLYDEDPTVYAHTVRTLERLSVNLPSSGK